MSRTGPVPKRSSERVRRNKPDVPIEKVEAIGLVEPPPLGLRKPRKLIEDMYEAMKESAQSKYYEPSDWAFARITLALLDEQLKAPKANSQIVATIMSNFGDLLVTEGERRRARMEIERSDSAPADNVVDVAAVFAERAAQG